MYCAVHRDALQGTSGFPPPVWMVFQACAAQSEAESMAWVSTTAISRLLQVVQDGPVVVVVWVWVDYFR